MTRWSWARRRGLGATLGGLLLLACDASSGPRSGGLTNWLRACESDGDCGDLRCLCGACTRTCEGASACADLAGSDCAAPSETGVVALCGGAAPASPGLCLARCDDGECPPGTACVADLCSPVPEPTAHVTIDTARHYQPLIGFGGTVAFVFDEIAQHPRKAALFDAMFRDSGFEVLRIRNRFAIDGADSLGSSVELLDAATARLGHAPTTILSSWSPPGTLKANGSHRCENTPQTCTLATTPDGAFDYAGFGSYWRDTLEGYAAAGIVPDFVGLQNDPDWVPAPSESMEACRMLPVEGTRTVSTDSGDVEARYAGFDAALAAAAEALSGLDPVPAILAPEATNVAATLEYASQFDVSLVGGIAHHLYGSDADAIDRDALADLAAFGQAHDLPILQTEMQAEGFDTAVLAHHALVDANAAAYLQNDFVGSASALDNSPTALCSLSEDDFVLKDPYHALRQYARFTAPGWVRVGASADTDSLLASAWLAPDEDALTLVLVNVGLDELAVELSGYELAAARSTVTRTAFLGTERSVELGVLDASRTVRVPGHAVVTVALSD